ncbi:alpha/beta hydrolase-fold protein [Flagellimonas sp. DF-77]|uniref:alpha/beta hydrolase-fold protein n=1 Tax=Flagellimonas algarum TaxID=3230298 RepID=UPI003399B883
MQKTALSTLGFLLLACFGFGQAQGTPNIVGTNYELDSEHLNGKRTIQVHLPPDYAESEADYPVLYLLDGQFFYEYAVSLSQKFKQSRRTPDFIIVGISTSYPQRFRHFSNGKDDFVAFLKSDLLPFVKDNFRTNGEQLLFGWEYAGSLAFHIMVNEQIPFNAFLLASPFPIWDAIAALDGKTARNSMLYFSVSPDEYQVNHGTEKLDTWLASKDIPGLDWSYAQLPNDEHHSTGYPTLYHGLRQYFKYYPEFQEDSFKKFIKAGGLDYAKAYSAQRAETFGFDPELSSWSKFTIIRAAMRANDYGHFTSYCDAFVTDAFIADLKFRMLDIADFHEINGHPEKAVAVYEGLLPLYPDSENLLRRMAKTYAAMGSENEAKNYRKRAEKVAKSKN